MVLNLVNICLDAIVSNFRRFNWIFNETEDENMKLKFQFLQKRYSVDLIEKLRFKEDLPEEFGKILINKYLKVLDTSWFNNFSWKKVTSTIAEIGCNVEKINVVVSDVGNGKPWQDIIRHLPNLKRFIFNFGCNDLILQNVAKFCPDIEEISIEYSRITSKAAKYLSENKDGKALCTKLKTLCIEGTPIKNNDVKYLLKKLPSLDIIGYRDLPLVLYSMHKNDLFLHKLKPYNITKLDLMDMAETNLLVDVLKVCLSVCPYLKNFSCRLVNQDDLIFFSNLLHLEELYIKNISDSEININSLLESCGGKLTSLTIVSCAVSMSVLCKNCPRIKKLTLAKVHFLSDEDSSCGLNSLTSLKLENWESLLVVQCDLLSNEIKSYLLKCCKLYPIKNITFDHSVIEKEYIKDILCNCTSLRYLIIETCLGEHENALELVGFFKNNPEIHFSGQSGVYQRFDITGCSGITSTFFVTGNSNRYIYIKRAYE